MREQILAALIASHDAEDAGNWDAPCYGLRFEPTMYTPEAYASELEKTLKHIFGPTVRLVTSETEPTMSTDPLLPGVNLNLNINFNGLPTRTAAEQLAEFAKEFSALLKRPK